MPETLPHLILLEGDLFLRKRKSDLLLAQMIAPESREMGVGKVDAKECGALEFIRQARSYAMMGGNQVFVIRNVTEWKKDAAPHLEAFFSKVPAWSYVFVEADELKEIHFFQGIVQRFGKRISCGLEERSNALGMIHQKLKRENRTMTKDAWELLQEKTGGNLNLMDLCIDRMLLYVDEKQPIDIPAVEKLADQALKFDSFDLTNAVLDHDACRAVEVFRYLYRLEGSPLGVIGLLNWQLKRVWTAKHILEEEGASALRSKIRMPQAQYGRFIKQVERFKWDELKEAFDRLFALDWKLKTGAVHEEVVVETFISELALPRAFA